MKKNITLTFVDSKPHYEILDALRGVAALLVIWYHIYEGFSFAQITNGDGDGLITSINHGYLAVDFFFMLSGFVISYAYDDRWGKMTLGNFFRRRLIRLHPMLIMGAVIGALSFVIGGREMWDGNIVSYAWVGVALLLTCLFIPAIPGTPYDVRGNGEMFPLNGPSWSLFYEYIGNIVYGIFIRRLSTRWLTALCIALGIGMTSYALGNVSGYGSIGVGWTLDSVNVIGGLLRMLFPFTMGMVLARNFKPVKIKGAFWICSAVLVLLFTVPYIEGLEPVCMNSVYEMACVIIAFPALVWIGASGSMDRGANGKICKFLGDISFPVYIVHYPVMYLFYSYLIENRLYTLEETWVWVAVVCIGSISLAYLCLKLYDIPLRRYLSLRFIKTSNKENIIK